MLRLCLAAAAADDFRGIGTCSEATVAPVVARAHVPGVQRTIDLRRERPAMGSDEKDLGERVRGFSFRSHRIYDEAGAETPLVLRTWHHARDARRWIGDQA